MIQHLRRDFFMLRNAKCATLNLPVYGQFPPKRGSFGTTGDTYMMNRTTFLCFMGYMIATLTITQPLVWVQAQYLTTGFRWHR